MPIIPSQSFEAGEWLNHFPLSRHRTFFEPLTLDFLHALSRAILTDPQARQFPDLMTFGYFCRKANLQRLLDDHTDHARRFGWGTVVHIAPANIPINFAFSLVFGMLAGNSNIVRMPTRTYPQNAVLLELFEKLLEDDRFATLSKGNIFIQSERGSDRLEAVIRHADGLVVWGGDATVKAFRSLEKKPRCVELYFPNRASSALINADHYLDMDGEAQTKLARDFYNDTYLVDQNACSSPSIVMWHGKNIEAAKSRFWSLLEAELKAHNYELAGVARIDKLLDVMDMNKTALQPLDLQQYAANIWAIEGDAPKDAHLRFGQFAEVEISTLSEIGQHIRTQEQTLTYSGFKPQTILDAIAGNSSGLVDRIVPIGRALDIGIYWDGKDVVSLLSRRIAVA